MRADQPHPQIQTLLDTVASMDVFPLNQYGPQGARDLMAEFRPDVEGPDLAEVTDRTVPGPAGAIPSRMYRPEGDGPFPTVVYFHGGGFVLGDLDGHDITCRHLARESGCVLVSVDYRLAPENPYPAALEDAYAATEWVAANPNAVEGSGTLAVAGDSAGGNLAAAVALKARDEGGPDLDYQLLVYPAVSADPDRWPSHEENASGYYLESEDMAWFVDCYLGDDPDPTDPYAFPLAAETHADLPPATVLTAGFDPLRDEGIAYAEALAEAGVPVEHRHYPDGIHGILSMLAGPADLDLGHEAVADVARDLRAAL